MLDEVVAAGERAGERALAEARAQAASGGASIDHAAALAVFLASDASAPLSGKVLSAPHDAWDTWPGEHLAALAAAPWYTMRRLDPFTVAGLREPAP
jgi:hypothetical protein